MIALRPPPPRAALLLGACLVLVACEDEPPPSRRSRGGAAGAGDAGAAEAPAPKSADAADGNAPRAGPDSGRPEEEEVYTFNENFSGRDPFRSYLPDFIVKPGEEGEGLAEIRTQLERFDLSELQAIAIITGTAVPKAMVTDPSGMGHVIQPGTRLGRRGGKVVRISTNSIVVRHIDEEVGSAKETRIRLHDEDESEQYRLNIVRHDLEAEEKRQAAAKESVLEGLDIDTLLKEDKGPGASRGAAPAPEERPAAEGGAY